MDNIQNKNRFVDKVDIQQIIGSLLQENVLFDNNYFSIFHDNLKLVVKSNETAEKDAKSIILASLNELCDKLKTNGNAIDLIAISSILDVLLYPLRLDVTLNKKTYKSFNIDIDFFNNIKNINTKNFYEEDFNNMILVNSFNFNKKNKLNNFILHKYEYNIMYEYNSKYICKAIIFSDGSKMKIDNMEINAKKKNKKN